VQTVKLEEPWLSSILPETKQGRKVGITKISREQVKAKKTYTL